MKEQFTCPVTDRKYSGMGRGDWHTRYGACYECCDRCNVDEHRCQGCGEPLAHNGVEPSGLAHLQPCN